MFLVTDYCSIATVLAGGKLEASTLMMETSCSLPTIILHFSSSVSEVVHTDHWLTRGIICRILMSWDIFVSECQVHHHVAEPSDTCWGRLMQVVEQWQQGFVVPPAEEMCSHNVLMEDCHPKHFSKSLPVNLAVPTLLLKRQGPS